jgi:hypothetical protein
VDADGQGFNLADNMLLGVASKDLQHPHHGTILEGDILREGVCEIARESVVASQGSIVRRSGCEDDVFAQLIKWNLGIP